MWWIISIVILTALSSGCAENTTVLGSTLKLAKTLNSTENDKPAISEKHNNENVVHSDSITSSAPNGPETELLNNEINIEEFNFKYYWILLVFSSVSILIVMIYKTIRLRRNRAEIKYGKANTVEEVQPLERGSQKWEDDSSTDDEDQIFDINFLKNTRLQKNSVDA